MRIVGNSDAASDYFCDAELLDGSGDGNWDDEDEPDDPVEWDVSIFSSHFYFVAIYFIFTILFHILSISQHVSRQCHDTVTTLKFLDAFISLRSIIFKYICLYFAYYLRIAFHAR